MAPEAYFQLKIRRQGGRGWPVIAAATRLWVARVPLARAWGSTLSGEPLGWRPKRRAVALQRVRNTVFMQQGQGHTSKVRLPPSPCAHLSHAAVSLCLWFAAPTPLAVAPLPRSLLCPPGDAAPSPRSLLCPPGVALPLVAAPKPSRQPRSCSRICGRPRRCTSQLSTSSWGQPNELSAPPSPRKRRCVYTWHPCHTCHSYHFSKQHTDSTILWLGRPPLGCRRRQNVPPLPQQKARWQMCPWPLLRPLEQRPRRNKRPKKCSKLLPRYWRSARTQSKMQRMPFRSQRVAPPGAGKACIVKSCIVLLHCC